MPYLQLQSTEQGESILSVWTPRPLTNLDTGVGVPDPSRKKIFARELLVFICMSYYFDKPHVVVRDLSLPAELPFWRQKNSVHFWDIREVIQEKENQQWAYHRAFWYSIDSNLTEDHLWHLDIWKDGGAIGIEILERNFSAKKGSFTLFQFWGFGKKWFILSTFVCNRMWQVFFIFISKKWHL